MEAKWRVSVTMALLVMLVVVSGDESSPVKTSVKMVKGKKVCDKGLGVQRLFCSLLQPNHFWLFPDLPVRELVSETQHSFRDHHSSITAASWIWYHCGGKLAGQKEIASFPGLVGSKTSCEQEKNQQWLIRFWNLGFSIYRLSDPCSLISLGFVLQQGNGSQQVILRWLLWVCLSLHSWSFISWQRCLK